MTPYLIILCFIASIGGAFSESNTVQVGALNLKIPSTWKKEATSSSMRAGQFSIQEGDQKIEYIIYYFGGGGGSVDANINRWIGQFQAEGRSHDRTEGDSKNGKYHLVDIQGTFNKSVGPPMMGKTTPVPGSRVMAAVIQTEKGYYFIKFIGTQSNIKKHKNDFLDSFGAK